VFAQGNAFGQLWLFWVAPVLGAVLTGLIFRGFGSSDELHGATAGGVGDLTAEATRDDGTRVSETSVAPAEAGRGDARDAGVREPGSAPAAEAEPAPAADPATAEPAPETERAPERTADDDARDFFDKDR
jgi:aquaporin Z